jgi:hypothetical protein
MDNIEMKFIVGIILLMLGTAQALKVGAYGAHYSGSWLSGLATLDTAATADLHLGYHLPYGSKRQYLTLSPTVDVELGSVNHLAFSLLNLLKVTLELNLIGVKVTPWGSVMVDTIRYSDICGETGLILEAAEI